MFVSASTPKSAGLTQSCGTKIRPPPNGIGADERDREFIAAAA